MGEDEKNYGSRGAGIDEWLKRVTIILALLYVMGYVAFKAYAGCFGLTPREFGMEEKDYVIQGISFLIPNLEYLMHPEGSYRMYDTRWILAWLLFCCGIHLAFSSVSAGRRFHPVWYFLKLGFVFISLDIVAYFQGISRAYLEVHRFDQLPPVTVAYESPEAEHGVNFAVGNLLASTEKFLCVANVIGQTIGTNSSQSDSAFGYPMLLIPTDKIVRIEVMPPLDQGQEQTNQIQQGVQ